MRGLVLLVLLILVGSATPAFGQGSIRVRVDYGSSSATPSNPAVAKVVDYTGPGPYSHVLISSRGVPLAWFLPGTSPIDLKKQINELKEAHRKDTMSLPRLEIDGQAFEKTLNGNLVCLAKQETMLAWLETSQKDDPTRVVVYGQGDMRFVSTSGESAPDARGKVYSHRNRKVRPVGEYNGQKIFVYVD